MTTGPFYLTSPMPSIPSAVKPCLWNVVVTFLARVTAPNMHHRLFLTHHFVYLCDTTPIKMPAVLSRPVATTALVLPRFRRCCRCNGTAKCLRCSCVRNAMPCSCCLPGESGNCHNTLPRGEHTCTTLPSSVVPSVSSSASSCASSIHLASMKSLVQQELSAGSPTTEDRQSLNALAQRSLAPLGTCLRVGMEDWMMVGREGRIISEEGGGVT